MFSKKNKHQTKFFLLRHGQSTYNALGLYQGSSNHSILTELGRQQGQKVGNFLKNLKFDAIYVSPLQRAQETCQLITQSWSNSPSVHILDNLRETDLPLWQGIPFEQVKKQFPIEYRQWKQRPHEFSMELTPEKTINTQKGLQLLEKTESFYPALDLYQRVGQIWQTLLHRHLGQNILIISHSGTNKALISTALGISPAYYHCFQQDNCAVNLLTFTQEGFPSGKLEHMNQATQASSLPPTKGGGLRLIFVPKEGNSRKSSYRISKLLKNEVINFSIADHYPNSLKITQTILSSHPYTLQFQVKGESFAELWYQTIYQRNQRNSQTLSTRLILASTEVIQRFIGQVFDISPCQSWRFSLHPATVSVLHFPTMEELPKLQTLNLSLQE